MDVRHHVEIGDEVKTDDGRSGVLMMVGTENRAGEPIEPVAVIDPGHGRPHFEHPAHGLARIHPKPAPALLHWEDAELVELWMNMPANTRGGVKALAYARLVLAGKPRK